MWLVSGQKYFVGVIEMKWREVQEIVVLVWKRKMNFPDTREFLEHGFAHRIERVLQRFAVVIGKCFQESLPGASL